MSQNLDNTLVQWAELLSSHDTDNFLSLFTGDCIYEDMAFGLVNHGTKELHDYIDGIFAAFPDFHIELKSRMVAGERGAMEWVMRGTHHGDLPGLPATHKAFSIRGATIVEFDHERIRRNSDYWDVSAFLKQVGLMPNA
jgi:steroid delta-isomerase-like uncharacterized protein